MKFSLKLHHFLFNPYVKWKKLLFDDILVMTSEQVKESLRKKKAENPGSCVMDEYIKMY